jgi:hypothetical protein
MRSIPGLWLREQTPASWQKRIDGWAEGVSCIDEVWISGPRFSDQSDFGGDFDIWVRLNDSPSEEELRQRIAGWSVILAASFKVRAKIQVLSEAMTETNPLKSMLLGRLAYKRS